MPNLLPDWLPWIHPAGRLIWSVILFTVGMLFVFALMKPPLLKRPFPNAVGYSIFAIVPIVGWVIAGLLPDTANISNWELDAIIVDLVLIILVAHGLLMVASRKPQPVDELPGAIRHPRSILRGRETVRSRPAAQAGRGCPSSSGAARSASRGSRRDRRRSGGRRWW